MSMPWESITAFYDFQKNRKPLTLANLKDIFAASCGYMNALRACGLKAGDALFMDGVYAQMEICRHAREVFGKDMQAWWAKPV